MNNNLISEKYLQFNIMLTELSRDVTVKIIYV